MFLGFLDQCHHPHLPLAGPLRKEATKQIESAPDRKMGEVTEGGEEITSPTYNPMHLPTQSIALERTYVNIEGQVPPRRSYKPPSWLVPPARRHATRQACAGPHGKGCVVGTAQCALRSLVIGPELAVPQP